MKDKVFAVVVVLLLAVTAGLISGIVVFGLGATLLTAMEAGGAAFSFVFVAGLGLATFLMSTRT
ncbi:hypothetical protein [Streptomyces sp. NPDC001389]|uniref:hypothetical protein n=1 Tax=Streptomyces sp. NPDC001389 TaxID=3364569 RepID=UPI0036C6BB2B